MTAQEEFDKVYITSSEICRTLDINRTTVLSGRKRGLLPDPIVINDGVILIWKRETVEPYLAAWRIALQSRRKELVG